MSEETKKVTVLVKIKVCASRRRKTGVVPRNKLANKKPGR